MTDEGGYTVHGVRVGVICAELVTPCLLVCPLALLDVHVACAGPRQCAWQPWYGRSGAEQRQRAPRCVSMWPLTAAALLCA